MSTNDPGADRLRAALLEQQEPCTVESYSDTVAALFRTKDQELKRFLASRLGSPDEAQEVAQEAYARLLALDKPETPSILVFRLWRIAANLAKDRIKLRAIRRRIGPVALLDPIVAAPSPEPLCIAHERIGLVERALEELPPRCRQAFMLRILDDRQYEEVALLVGVDARTAKRYVARALAHCQRVINMAERGPT
jgi:RNA polymerase sigma-70 factor (ECF subfamily)